MNLGPKRESIPKDWFVRLSLGVNRGMKGSVFEGRNHSPNLVVCFFLRKHKRRIHITDI